MHKHFPVLLVTYHPFTFLKPQPCSFPKQEVCPRCLFAPSSVTHWWCGVEAKGSLASAGWLCHAPCAGWAGLHPLSSSSPPVLLAHLPSPHTAWAWNPETQGGSGNREADSQRGGWKKAKGSSFASSMDFLSSAHTLIRPLKAEIETPSWVISSSLPGSQLREGQPRDGPSNKCCIYYLFTLLIY